MKITPRTPSTYGFESNIEKSSAQSIPDQTIESRHIDNGEVEAKHFAQAAATSGAKIGAPIVINFAITADASSGLNIYDEDAPIKFRIIDVIVECTTANASGTVTVSNGTTDITDAIACATDKAIDRADSIDDAVSTIDVGESVVVTTNGAADRGVVSIIAIPVA